MVVCEAEAFHIVAKAFVSNLSGAWWIVAANITFNFCDVRGDANRLIVPCVPHMPISTNGMQNAEMNLSDDLLVIHYSYTLRLAEA